MKGRGRQASLQADFEDGSDWSSLRSVQVVVDKTPKLGRFPKEMARNLEWERFLESSRPPKDEQSTHVNEWMAMLPGRSAGDDINRTASFEKHSENAATKGIPTNILVRNLHCLFVNSLTSITFG